MFAALVTTGYESHDDYIQTGECVVNIPTSDTCWTFAQAEDRLYELFFAPVGSDDYDDRAWVTIKLIERVPEPELALA